MGYRILGFAVWKGARWYVARKYPWLRPVATGALVAGVLAVAAAKARPSARGVA